MLQSGWGDEDGSSTSANKYYEAERYDAYSPATRRNLARLNEHVVDYDLLEDLVNFLCQTEDEGAILVFLPGMSSIVTTKNVCLAVMFYSGPTP